MPGAGPNITQGKIDVALSQFALGYRNNALVGSLLFPRVSVQKQSDKYWKFDRSNQKTSPDLRAPGTPAQRIDLTISNDSYVCDDHSQEALLPDEERANFEAGDIEQAKTQLITDRILLNEEVEIADFAVNNANYAAGNKVQLAGADQFSDYANSDPLGVIEDAKAAIRLGGMMPNRAILGDSVWKKLKNHPALLERFKFTTPGGLTLAQLATLLEIDSVTVASAVKVSDAGVASFVWGKHAIVGYFQDNPSMFDPSFGKTFIWAGAPGTVGGFSTELARAEKASAKSDVVHVHMYRGKKVTSNVSAYLIEDAVA